MSAIRNDLKYGALARAAGTLLLALALGCATSSPRASDEVGSADEPALAATEEQAEASDAAAQDPWAEQAATSSAEPSAEDAAAAAADAARIAADAAPPATKLLGITTEDADGGVRVALAADGRIDGADVFTVENPLRLVIDLPKLTSQGVPAKTDVTSALVARVRVAQHDGKVRVVIDAAEGVTSFGTPASQGVATGLALALGSASLAPAETATAGAGATDAETPIEEESEPVPASMPEGSEVAARESATPSAEASSTQKVLGVQFDSSAERDRVVIVSEATADYSSWQPDDTTVVISVRGAEIDPSAAVRIAPENPGVISLVTAFEQPDVAKPEVRVVIQRAAGVKPTIEQKGPMLVLDFARTATAAPVPVLTQNVETQPAAGQAAPAAARATAPALASAPAAAPARAASVPAALDSEPAIDTLEEGGLLEGKAYSGRRISLDFKDVEIDDVLRLIAEVSELNVIAGDEVTGHVTIRLVDVPWDQALDVILLTKGLGFVRVNSVLRIAPVEVLKAEEEARLQERRAKEKLEDLLVKLQPVNYANVEEVAKLVKKLLSARGSVDVDQRTNTIILKDIASVVDEATALIKAIDTQTPQVMIEAKIVEANLDFLREVGSAWATGVQGRTDAWDPGSSPLTSSTSRTALGSDGFRLRNVDGLGTAGENANSVAVANPITQLATGAINLGAFILDERFDVDLTLAAAESHGEGKVISSPRVVTLDNRKAAIEQGVSIPFQTFENGDAKLEFIDAVLKLEVTPHITADRSIIMSINVKRNAPDDSVPTPTGSPAIAKNEAKTETLVRDGQTLVIGGIYVVRQSERESRVPYFHRIPVLGNAFKNKEVRDIRQELLVFVTPRIVVNPELGA